VHKEKTSGNWISIDDNEDKTRWVFDTDFLLSNYNCIYGSGCESISTEFNSTLGCCTVGAHLGDKQDIADVEKAALRLTDDDWQLKSFAMSRKGPFKKSGDEIVTRLSDGACIFLNREDFHAGAGCALHLGALNRGERPIDWKPDVCWQVPIQLDVHENSYDFSTVLVREWERRDWGDGGEDFHWWCTEEKKAYNSKNKLYLSMKDELIELVGEDIYDRLKEKLDNFKDDNSVRVEITKGAS